MGEMQEPTDAQLLRDYAEHRDEAAFRELVSRHAEVVYASALRQVSSPDLAQDIAQTVFTDLARKAQPLVGTLTGDASLVGWLFRSTRFLALNQLRDDRRRQARERQAMQHFDPAAETAPEWERVQPVLDEAMADLNDEDREALLLRFFKNRDFRAIGAALGVSDDAAQKRVSRALERLRSQLTSRGVTTTAVALSTVLSTNAVPLAPAGLAATLSTAALAGTTLATTATAIKSIAMTTLQKTLITATIVAAVGTGIYEARRAATLRIENHVIQQKLAPLAAQIQKLQHEHDDATRQLAALRDDNERLKRNSADLLRLRGEVGTFRQQNSESENLRKANERLQTQITAMQDQPIEVTRFKLHRTDVVNAMKQLGLAMLMYSEKHNDQYPANFDQLSGNSFFSTKYPGGVGINEFEFVSPGLVNGRDTPDRIVFREQQPRQTPDGKWERFYGLADGSVQKQTSDDGHFDVWEKQHMILPRLPAKD